MKIIKVHTEKDILQIPNSGIFQLEVYLKNAVIDISDIQGNLFVRAKHCTFSKLETIHGILRVDDHYADFPMLKKVYGDVHANGTFTAQNLEIIFGYLKEQCFIEAPKIKYSRNNTRNNFFDIKKWSEVTSQEQLDALSEEEIKNIKIIHCNVTIHSRNLYSNIKIINARLSCPNLENLLGYIEIEVYERHLHKIKSYNSVYYDLKSGHLSNPFEAPKLKKIIGRFESITTIPITITASEIGGKTVIRRGKATINNLHTTNGIILQDGAHLDCIKLREIKHNLIVGLDCQLNAEALHTIGQNCELYGIYNLSNLTSIGKKLVFQLPYPGKYVKTIEYPYVFKKLQYVHGVIQIQKYISFPKLNYNND
ncbi:hypothetical protein [Kordia sp.]|uniref:hypothetical protein n=1 Tax=Kordia sp. TaxID=1965332 RepID=UPI003B5A787D